MIRSIKVELNAAFPNMPLLPFHVFHGSAAAITVLNVPRRIVSLSVKVKNVSAAEQVFPAQRYGSAWVVVIPGSFFEQSGTSTRGVKIDGVDEAGNIYTLGAADLVVMLDNGSVEPVSPTPSVLGKLPLRALPKYLYYLAFDDTYPADAQAFYDSIGGARVIGGCSIVRKGGLVGGNFDYPYDDACSFAIKVSAAKGANADGSDRHASVGAAYLGTRLTENIVSSGVNTPLYRVLPGMTESGINDAGVYAKINVIPRDPDMDPSQSSTRNLHALAVVRYVLDNFDNAAEAAEYVAAHYYIPEGSADSYHWMIADATDSYVVEDGESSIDESTVRLTNYRLYVPEDYGSGYSRNSILDGSGTVAELLEAVKFTNAYADGWPWPDDFAGQTDAQGKIPWSATERLKAWAEAHVAPLLDANRKPAARGNGCWQTVHSAIYDFEKKTMAICVQEDFSKRYVFAVDQANVDLTQIEDQIAALQDGKRDKADLDVYGYGTASTLGPDCFPITVDDPDHEYGFDFSSYSFDEDDDYFVLVDANGQRTGIYFNSQTGKLEADIVGVVKFNGRFPSIDNFPYMLPNAVVDLLAKESQLAGKQSKITASGVLKGDGSGGVTQAEKSSTSADPANADYRDPQDNTCHKTEFTPWEVVVNDPDETVDPLLLVFSVVEGSGDDPYWHYGSSVEDLSYDANATEIVVDPETVGWCMGGCRFHRSAVCIHGKKFVTSDVVDGKVSSAVSTNNPAFVSAVRNTPTENMPEDMPTDWGTYGTVGAALAALAAFVKWAKAKIVAVIGNDGKPTDTFATDLIGKPVAISAVQNIVNGMFDNGDTTAYPRTTEEG